MVARSIVIGGLSVALVAVLLPACARKPAAPVELGLADHANAHVTLAADGDRVVAAWTATSATGTDVVVAASSDGGRTFGAPVRVNDVDGDGAANGEAPPRVTLRDSAVHVVWISKRGGMSAIRSAASHDGGRTFAAARTISPPGVSGLRGWHTATITDEGSVQAVWLDGRAAPPRVSRPEAAAGAHQHKHQPGARMKQDLFFAAWQGDEPVRETQVAGDVCFCCKTAIATRGRDTYVAWRHIFPGSVRDIALARSTDGGATFSDAVRVSADDWKIDACPDDGPALAMDAQGVLWLAWPTMVEVGGKPQMAIFQTRSGDGGRTFAPRVRLDTAAGAAHPRLAVHGSRAAVVWDEIASGSRRVMIRIGDAPPRALSTDRIASDPSSAAGAGGFVAAWTDQSQGRSVIHVVRTDQARP
jgi:hypothetical protein